MTKMAAILIYRKSPERNSWVILIHEEFLPEAMLTIDKIDKSLAEYSEIADELKTKMSVGSKSHKSRSKPYWNNELQSLWKHICLLEKSKSKHESKKYAKIRH